MANLVAKMETNKVHPAPVFTNLKEFPFAKFRGCVDIMSGGFPCQPFSAAGKKKGTEDPRHLFPYILEGIKQCRPAVVFLENVEGIISSKTEPMENLFSSMSSKVWKQWVIGQRQEFSQRLKSELHTRKRVFIMGYTIDNGHLASTISRSISQSQEERRMQKLEGRGSQLVDSNNCGSVRRDETEADTRGEVGQHPTEGSHSHAELVTPTTSDHKGSGPTVIRKDGKDRSNGRLDYATETHSA